MTELQILLDKEKELESELEKVKQQIHNHPERIKERINNGLSEFSKLIRYDKTKRSKTKKRAVKIFIDSLADYELILDEDHNDIKPAQHYLHKFFLEDEWVITVGIFLEAGHQKYELSLNFKRGTSQINVWGYDSDIDEKMENIDEEMRFTPAYIYYKPLIRTFVKLLYVNLIDDYFNKHIES